MKRTLYKLCTHTSLILGSAFLILLLIEWLFPFLHFVESTPGHWLLLLLCLSTILSSLLHPKHGHKRRQTAEEKPASL